MSRALDDSCPVRPVAGWKCVVDHTAEKQPCGLVRSWWNIRIGNRYLRSWR